MRYVEGLNDARTKLAGFFSILQLDLELGIIKSCIHPFMPDQRLVRPVFDDTNLIPKLPEVQGDTGMIEQALVNLTVNARDAMPKGGRLAISTSSRFVAAEEAARHVRVAPGPFVCLEVADSGSGITPENLPHIFDPFFTTKEVGRGTGLGLATLYGIVEQHHEIGRAHV